MNILRRLARPFRRGRADADLAEEIESHRAMLQDRFESRGMTAADAARASQRAIGNLTLAREDARQVWISRGLESAGRISGSASAACDAVPTARIDPVVALRHE